MSAGEFQRIQGAMVALGWAYGTYRLYDLGRTQRSARKGFWRGNSDEQKTEMIAKRIEGGVVVLEAVVDKTVEGSPF
nr:hypothetical protein [Devosia naphthalenivorans]